MQLAKDSNQKRKSDARKKIMLGGLFIKAELDCYYPHDPALLYGMLLYSKELLKLKPELARIWKNLGKERIINTKI